MTRYVIKTKLGYVTSHRRGRMTPRLESARTFKSILHAERNRFANSMDSEILEVNFSIALKY